MTVAQKRNAGIYHNQAGQRVPANRVAQNAVNRLINGQPLTRNQNHLVGTAMRNMTPAQRRNLTNNLALVTNPGQNVNHTEEVQQAVGQCVEGRQERQAQRARGAVGALCFYLRAYRRPIKATLRVTLV
jgi:hypothetical protein